MYTMGVCVSVCVCQGLLVCFCLSLCLSVKDREAKAERRETLHKSFDLTELYKSIGLPRPTCAAAANARTALEPFPPWRAPLS